MAASVGVVLRSATYSLQKATIYPISHTSAFKPTNAAGVLFVSPLCFLLKDLESFMHHYKSRCSLNRTKKDIWISNTRVFSSKMVLRIIHVLTMNAQPSKWDFFFFPVLSKKIWSMGFKEWSHFGRESWPATLKRKSVLGPNPITKFQRSVFTPHKHNTRWVRVNTGFEPGAAGWEGHTLPLCYAPPTSPQHKHDFVSYSDGFNFELCNYARMEIFQSRCYQASFWGILKV